MQVSGSTYPVFAAASLRIVGQQPALGGPGFGSSSGSLADFARSVIALRESVLDVGSAARIRRLSTGSSARASSISALGLASVSTATTLSSSEEINTETTSFTPGDPEFEGASGSSPTVSGVYDGSNGDTTLTFTVTSGGVVGIVPAEIEVRDDQDALVDTIDLGFDPAGTAYTLANGLEVEFSSGSLVLGDSFEVDVSTSGPSVDPDNPFDGTGSSAPGFETGVSVGAGSFEVNGVSISVASSDTIQDVLDRITASAANVQATYDAALELVVLSQKSTGSSFDVQVGNDTSGFLAAVKLDGASAVQGSDDELSSAVSQVSALSGIASGSFHVNGVELTVDVSSDSLADLLAAIEGSGAGVSASYHEATGRVVLRADDGDELVLDDGDSGFFTAIGVQPGTYEEERRRAGLSFTRDGDLRLSLLAFTQAFADVFEGSFSGFGAATAEGIRSGLEDVVATVYEEVLGASGSGTLRSGLGLDFLAGSSERRLLELDPRALGRGIGQNASELHALLFAEGGSGEPQGLFPALEERLEVNFGALATLLGEEAVGLGLDLSA